MPDTARAIRIFVSSTFRDFMAERDRLARFAFPALRRLCEERGVVFTDVDLRWGITDEQAAEGEVLPICLAEIDSSRPFFIGILGERYGWVPDSIADELVERQKWLGEHRDRSVTELEIVHGVLNDPKMAGRAFFYFRDPEASTALGPDAMPEDDQAAAKLADLKARIRASGLLPREGFRDASELAEWVASDITAAIEELFPTDETPDPTQRERVVHDAFAAELAAGFVGRPDLLAALDAHADSDAAPLLVTGESGFGKSALLAHWSREWAHAHPGTPVIAHFCGASPAASDWVALCRRVAAELEIATGVTAELPDDPAELKAAFKGYLFRAAAACRFVLALDGIDQLEDRDAAPDLAFLPPEPPVGCRLVVSAASGTRPVEETVRREWATLAVGELEPSQREAVLRSLLACRAKTLDPARVERVCAAPVASSALFLSVLADELSVVGAHDTLDVILERYLDVEAVDDLYERVLERFERDYDARPGLVRDTMRAIWAARRGIAERELLEVLGDEEPLPQVMLAPLLLAAGRQLTSRGGLLTFTHALLRTAVEDRYLPDDDAKRDAHRVLGGHFERGSVPVRIIDELPWQLQRAEEWERLAGLLANLVMLHAIWEASEYDARRYWAAIEQCSEIRMIDVYRDATTSGDLGTRPSRVLDTLWGLLSAAGHYKLAEMVDEKRTELDGMSASALEERERGCRQRNDRAGLATCLGFQAYAAKRRCDPKEALRLERERGEILRSLGDMRELNYCLSEQASLLSDEDGGADAAIRIAKERERILRGLGDMWGVASALSAQASVVAHDFGQPDEALELYRQEELILRDLGDLRSLEICLGAQASILERTRGAEPVHLLLRERIDLLGDLARDCRESGDVDDELRHLGDCARLLEELGDLATALSTWRVVERTQRELGSLHELPATLGSQASILERLRDFDAAMNLHRECDRMCRDSEDLRGRFHALVSEARLMRRWQRLEESAAILDEAARVLGESQGEYERMGRLGPAIFAHHWRSCRAMKAKCLRGLGREEDAITIWCDIVALAPEGLDRGGDDARCYQEVANTRRLQGLLSEALVECDAHDGGPDAPDHVRLAWLGLRAQALVDDGRIAEARECLVEKRRACDHEATALHRAALWGEGACAAGSLQAPAPVVVEHMRQALRCATAAGLSHTARLIYDRALGVIENEQPGCYSDALMSLQMEFSSVWRSP